VSIIEDNEEKHVIEHEIIVNLEFRHIWNMD